MSDSFVKRVMLPHDVALVTSLQADPAPAPRAATPVKQDTYQTALLKLIPAEIVAVFLTLDGAIVSGNMLTSAGYWGVFALMVVLCFMYGRFASAAGGLPPSIRQALVASLAFVAWVFAIGGPFEYAKLNWYSPGLGSILLPLFTLIAPFLVGVKPQAS